jgi:hypothetical protein
MNLGQYLHSRRLTQNGKTRSKNWERLARNVHFWPPKLPKKCAVREQRGSYAASFVTKECAASLVCDPTILISCQS